MRAARQILCFSSLAVALLLAGKTTVVSAAETLSPIKPEGDTELTYQAPSGTIVRVKISQTRLDPSSFPYKGGLLWGGDVDQLPQTVLSSIQITQSRKTVFIALSAYSDLGDVKFASLEPTKEGFALHLHGGNTAASYDATLSFRRGYLRTR